MESKYIAFCHECGHEWPDNGRPCRECGNEDYEVVLAAFAGDVAERRSGGLDSDAFAA